MSNPNERQLGELQEDYRKRRLIDKKVDEDYLRSGTMFFRSRVVTSTENTEEGKKNTGYSQTYVKPKEVEDGDTVAVGTAVGTRKAD